MNEQQIRDRMRDDGATDDEIERVTDDLADEAMQRRRDEFEPAPNYLKEPA